MKPFTNVFNKLTALCVISLALTACSTPSQVYWDAKVKEMCEKDGGVTVYERVALTRADHAELIQPGGNVVIPFKGDATASDPYYLESRSELIKDGNPRVLKHEDFVYRNNDKKIMSKKIMYSRSGGDLPNGISHPSSFSCNEIGKYYPEIIESTFFVEGK